MTKKTDDGTLQTTKQMLDELDALMDRMLSLPVSDADDEPPLPEKPAVLSAKLTLLESPPAPSMVAPTPIQQMPQLLHTNPPVNPPHFTPPPVQPTPLTNDVVPPSVMPQVETLLKSDSDEPAPLGTQLGYLPLWWINDRFDNAVNSFPVVSTLLRSQNGRGLLGFLGIVLSAAAFGWLLKDLLGWN